MVNSVRMRGPVTAETHAKERGFLCAVLAAIEDRTAVAALPHDGQGDQNDDADLFLRVARRHRLTPLLSAVCGDALTGALAQACRNDRLMTAARNLRFAQIGEECLRGLAGAGVPVIVLKGIAYERLLYAGAGARPTADVDLLVPSAQRRAAFRALDRLGFEPRAAAPGFDDADYHEVAWRREDVEVDLHLALAPTVRCDIDYQEVWGRAEPITIGETDAKVLHAEHAAVFHGLHMAIDHFDVPALYLIDLARLLPSEAELAGAEETARAWGCWRPFATATALAEAFLPVWRAGHRERPAPWRARQVVARFGPIERLPRWAQLARKVSHFDDPVTALRYAAVQGWRKGREVALRRFGGRSARERLGLDRE